MHHPQKLGGGFLKAFAVSEAKDDPVLQEMVRLKMTGNPPPSEVDGIRLTPQQHHDYVAFSANNPDKSLSLKKTLHTLISSPNYARLSDEVQREQLETLMGEFRHLGQGLLFQKYPELQRQSIGKKLKKLTPKNPNKHP